MREEWGCKLSDNKWSISTNEENYHGQFDSKEDAISEGQTYCRRFWVGRCVPPTPPEELFTSWDVEEWLDNRLICHDDYSGEWAEDAIQETSEQREELAAEIRKVISAWLDKHNLRPKFFVIAPESVEEFEGEGS